MKKIIKSFILSIIMGVMVLGSSVVFADTIGVTWNPNDIGSKTILTNNNLTASGNLDTLAYARASKGVSNGKWYWEIKIDSYGEMVIGVASADKMVTQSILGNNFIRVYNSWSGETFPNHGTYGSPYNTNDVIGVALDMDNKTITFYKNGINQGIAFLDLGNLSGKIYPFISSATGGDAYKVTADFGASTFNYPVPTGYLPYNSSANLATGITLNKSTDNIPVGQTDTLIATVTPDNATNKTVTWKSSDPSVATVDENGKVTSVTSGSAIITATTTDGSNLSATCVVTVTNSTTPSNPTTVGNRAKLTINMNNGPVKQYDLSASELTDFLTWYDNRSKGTAASYYVFNVPASGPYLNKKDYISFDRINDYEVQEYNSIK